MARRTLTVTVRITGIRETLRAFRNWPDDARRELRAASLSIAGVVAVRIKTAAAQNPQSALMVPTVRARLDNVPTIEAGRERRVGSNRVPAYKVLFGSEFGSHVLPQFRAFNTDGYWFFRTVKTNEGYIEGEYLDAVDEVNRKWGL